MDLIGTRPRRKCFGLPRYVAPQHQTAIALLRERLTVPGFASKLSALERAELELLAAAPQDFVSCIARRGQGQKKA